MRFAMVCLVVGLSFPTIRMTLAIDSFSHITDSMMKGAKLPAMTSFIFAYRAELVRLAFGLPVVAVAMFFVSSRSLAMYLLGVLVMLSAALCVTLLEAYLGFVTALIKNIS